ncbi:MAG: hypothetical protein IKR53_05895 [Clostridia bacterium]|nr:hypothetical protein [Clostridia bacterium]
MKKPTELFRGRRGIVLVAAFALGIFLLTFDKLPFHAEKESGDSEPYYRVSFYTENLEKRIKELCRSCDGVGDVHVLLTLDSGSEYVYASDVEQRQEGSGASVTREYLLVSTSDGDEPVKVTEIYPKIRGVAVVCSGGDRADVREKITSLLSAALGIPTNRIRVSS